MKNAPADSSILNDVSSSQWEALSRKKIYFGHQSVGLNIIEGLVEIIKSCPEIKLNIQEISSPADLEKPLFGHSLIGQNRNPQSKIEHFARLMENGLGDRVDLAFFKFCYVDIVAETNAEEVFSSYNKRLADLQTKYPRVRFLTVTAPLTTNPSGLKATVKKMLGRTLRTETDNIKRNSFNALLREKYKSSLFDLAEYEATYVNGEKAVFIKNDQKYGFLRPEYSDDGGHLNALGRKVISRRLLLFLIKEIEKKQ